MTQEEQREVEAHEIETADDVAQAYDIVEKMFPGMDVAVATPHVFDVYDDILAVGSVDMLLEDLRQVRESAFVVFSTDQPTAEQVLGMFDRIYFVNGTYRRAKPGRLEERTEALVKAVAIAEKVFGDKSTIEGVFEVYDYLDVAKSEEDFASDLKRTYKYAKKAFKTEAPTPGQVFGLFDKIFVVGGEE